jgi:hypothetical protein
VSRVLRCAACTRRIKPHHPHIGVEDLTTGEEYSYHSRPGCQEHGALETAARLGEGNPSGKVYVMHHYHSSACPDKAPGFGCTGGCFATSPTAVAN